MTTLIPLPPRPLFWVGGFYHDRMLIWLALARLVPALHSRTAIVNDNTKE